MKRGWPAVRYEGAQPVELKANAPSAVVPTLLCLRSLPTGEPDDQTANGKNASERGNLRMLRFGEDPQFPSGLFVARKRWECGARIGVSAEGAVAPVEITRRSVYTEVDASVEAARRECLFSRVDEVRNAVGAIKFRFRLEKRD